MMEVESQVRVRFVTDHDEFRIADTPFVLPANLNRAGLSNVVNHLLSHGEDDTVDFDFEIQERLLRSKLSTFIKKYRVVTEDIIVVKYFPVVSVEEEEGANVPLPAWLGSLGVTSSGVGFAGCYDGQLKIFDAKNLKEHATVQCHEAPIRDLTCWHQPGGTSSFLVTASKDCSLKVWSTDAKTMRTSHLGTLSRHGNSMESVAHWFPNGSSQPMVLSGDWNGTIIGWKLNVEEGSEQADTAKQAKKKRKDDNEQAVPVFNLSDSSPQFTMKAHAQAVTCILAPSSSSGTNSSLGFTSSWDHSIKMWDWTRQDCVTTYNTSKVVTSLAATSTTAESLVSSQVLLASSHTDGKIRIWDGRVQESSAGAAVLTLGRANNSEWISQVGCTSLSCFMLSIFLTSTLLQVTWQPNASGTPLLASVNFSGELCLWDLRSSLPQSTQAIHEGKAITLAWHEDKIISGGSDCCLKSSVVK